MADGEIHHLGLYTNKIYTMEENVGYVSCVPFKYRNVCKAILKASKSNPFEFNITHNIFLLSLFWHYIKLLQNPCSGEVYIH